MSVVKPTPEPSTEVREQTESRLDETLRLLHTLFEDDETEQRDTFASLQRAIDEDRPSTRQRFRAP